MNWFRRHLNWTFIFAIIVAFIIAMFIAVALLLVDPSTPDIGLDITAAMITAAITLPVSTWILREKGRNPAWLLILFVPYVGWIFFLTLENHGYLTKPNSEIRQKCISYIIEENKYKKLQDEENTKFNNIMIEHGMSVDYDMESAQKISTAAKRNAEVAKEIVELRRNIKYIPDEVASIYALWQVAYSDFATYAEARYAAVKAVAEGMQPYLSGVQELQSRSVKSLDKAVKEELKLVKRLHLSLDEIRTLNGDTPNMEYEDT